MKAVILAGGFGTRLQPLTNCMAKPLVPLLGKPLVMHIIDSMPAGVDQVILAVNYRRQDLEDYFQENDVGREVILVDESEPLGTGGALRNLKEHLDETFMMFNGDIVCSLDQELLIDFHRQQGAMATLALWEVEDPQPFGVADLRPDGRIDCFQEKPAPGEELSKLINAGIYVFEPGIMDYIPEGKVSLEREVFPHILAEGMSGMPFQGYWADCGTLESFLEAQRLLLSHQHGRSQLCHPDARVKGASLGENVYVGNALVSPGASLEHSVVMDGAQVGEGCILRNCIVGPGENIIDESSIYDEILCSL